MWSEVEPQVLDSDAVIGGRRFVSGVSEEVAGRAVIEFIAQTQFAPHEETRGNDADGD